MHNHAQVIDQSHRRSQAYGLASSDMPDYSSPARSLIDGALEENRFLYEHAAPVMETLYGQIANTHSMVLLTSAQGLVLHSLGDTDFLEKAARVALAPGMDWSESAKGTNAVGTALREQEALTVLGNQHYMQANHFLACSCAPIFDPYGQVIGALDVTGDQRNHHQHTLALVRMSAQMVENHMFADIFPKALHVHFHTRAEFLATLVEGIAVFSHEGRLLSANRSAQFQLGLSFNALQAHTFASLFGAPISTLLDRHGHTLTQPQQLYMHNGVRTWCRATQRPATPWTHGTQEWHRPAAAPAAPATPAASPTPASPGVACALQALDTGDAQMHQVLHKVRRVSGHDIPILIQGETGTGKDLLARAIHQAGPRAGQPFISVNCASIPESLIESELFGYAEGAFTGARRKGAPGKIVQAHGGTLFLDEIGDMPPHLQARLLRVLQERRVSPLGADKEVVVDVRVVSATHKNLKALMAQGLFREDLYYRLNGLVVRLPALRERSDFLPVAQRMLQSLCSVGQAPTLSPEALALLQRCRWPGNARQLHNLLRTACVMAGADGVITPEHLPDDFLEELGCASPGPNTAAPSVSGAATPAGSAPALHEVTLLAMAQALRQHGGNMSAAARALGISRNTLYRKRHLLPGMA